MGGGGGRGRGVKVYVAAQFYPWFNKFYNFPLFWGMVIYDNEFETKKYSETSAKRTPN